MFIACSVQLYLPPEYMMNKDFLKEGLAEDKDLLRLDQVARINVPLYDELSVGNFFVWQRLLHEIAGISNYSEKLANRIRMLLTLK